MATVLVRAPAGARQPLPEEPDSDRAGHVRAAAPDGERGAATDTGADSEEKGDLPATDQRHGGDLPVPTGTAGEVLQSVLGQPGHRGGQLLGLHGHTQYLHCLGRVSQH